MAGEKRQNITLRRLKINVLNSYSDYLKSSKEINWKIIRKYSKTIWWPVAK